MDIQKKIENILKVPSGITLFKEVKEIGQNIIARSSTTNIIPDFAWEITGIKPDSKIQSFNCVGEKEYYYFHKCIEAAKARQDGDLDTAAKLLMEAKWDFDTWALAHYLLGLIHLENNKYKAAYAQLKQAAKLEPFNHLPMAIMREIANYIILNR